MVAGGVDTITDEAAEPDDAVYDPAVKCGEVITVHGWKQSQLRLVAVLGTGTYGAVYRAESVDQNDSDAVWAVKALWKSGLDEEQLKLQRLEIDINERLMEIGQRGRFARQCHPNIVPMRFNAEDNECLYLGMDLHRGSDLYDAVQEMGGLDDELAKHVFEQILDAVEFAHRAGVYHRDLKPENVLITSNWQCKLCDFGLSSMDAVTTELGCGSAPYMAPETRGGYKQEPAMIEYSCKEADIWSLGVVLINILFACNPWKVASDADPTFEAFVADPTVLKRQFALSEPAFELLRSMFELNPRMRPTIAQIRAEVRSMRSFVDEHLADTPVVLSSSPTDIMGAAAQQHPNKNSGHTLINSSHYNVESESEIESEIETESESEEDKVISTKDAKRGNFFEAIFQQFTLSEESKRTPSTAIAVY